MKQIIRILASARDLKKYYIGISILSILTSLSLILVPVLTGWAIDEVRNGVDADVSFVVALAIGLFVLDFLNNILNNWNGYLGDQMSTKLQRLLSQRYFEHLLRLPQTYFDKELSGTIINRLNRSINQITSFMQMFTNNFLQFVVSTVFALVATALYSWQVALMLFSLYPIYIWMTVKTSGKWQEYQEVKNKHIDIASGRFAEAINQLKVVKSFIRERHELSYFRRHWKTVEETNKPQSVYWHTRDFLRRAVLNVIFLAVYLYVFVSAARGEISPGQAVALVLFAQQIRIPIFTISYLVEATQKVISDSKDYYEVMAIEPAIADKPGARQLKVERADIRFDDVYFGYDGDRDVLKGMDFAIEAGKKVALVGESGEGKTTMTSLLLRLYEPRKGRVSLGGSDISGVTQQSLRNAIAVVFQEPALFSGTIRENVAYGRPNATMADVETAARAANAHEFISKLEDGYDTQIGERGLRLSGGQKQRIAIARALLKDAPVLILDEATSSLDSRSEQAVQQALERLMKGRTTLIIAHRLSTIQSVDQIITLKGGKIDEFGTPAELAGSGGIYSQLLALQQSGPLSESAKKRLKKFELVK